MRVFLVAHGLVQGVGYRELVRRVALAYKVNGMVRNVRSGGVEILAEAENEILEKFERDINVSFQTGPQVFRIERYYEDSREFPKDLEIGKYKGFFIEKTR